MPRKGFACKTTTDRATDRPSSWLAGWLTGHRTSKPLCRLCGSSPPLERLIGKVARRTHSIRRRGYRTTKASTSYLPTPRQPSGQASEPATYRPTERRTDQRAAGRPTERASVRATKQPLFLSAILPLLFQSSKYVPVIVCTLPTSLYKTNGTKKRGSDEVDQSTNTLRLIPDICRKVFRSRFQASETFGSYAGAFPSTVNVGE